MQKFEQFFLADLVRVEPKLVEVRAAAVDRLNALLPAGLAPRMVGAQA